MAPCKLKDHSVNYCFKSLLTFKVGLTYPNFPLLKGSDCVHPFVALQNCIKANPSAFSKDILEEDEVQKEEEPTQEYKIIPPIWSKESPSPKSKL
jgi:hypothetical protein